MTGPTSSQNRFARSFGWALALGAIASAAPGAAQNTPAPETAAERLEREKTEAAIVEQRIKLLGLTSSATGATELGEGGGQFEGWLLSSKAIDAAAQALLQKIETDTADRALVLLASEEAFDLGLPSAVSARLAFLVNQGQNTLAGMGCRQTPALPPAHQPDRFPVASALAAVGSVVGAFRTDTKITGFSGPDNARMVIAALVEQRANKGQGPEWYVPAEMIGVPTEDGLLATWKAVEAQRTDLATCRARLVLKGDAAKSAVAAIDAQIANIDDFAAKQIAPGDGASPLIHAARIDAITKRTPMILRIFIEKAGGSLLKRSNLWTALGAEAVGVTGGAVISWRLSDPALGSVIGGGNLACRTQLSGLRAVQEGRTKPSTCTWVETSR